MSFFNVGKFSLTNTDASSVVLTVPDTNLSEYTLTLPVNSGVSGYVLQTNGLGVTSWAAQAGGLPAGITAGQVIFADGGDFSGNNNLTYTALTSDLTLVGNFSATNNIEATGDVSGATANFGTITATGQTTLVDVSATNIEATGDVSGATANFGTITATGLVSGVTASFSTSTTTKANIMTPNVIDNYVTILTLDVSASVNIINYSDAGNATTTFNGVNDGQISHIFYNNGGGGNLQIDFGATNLVSGSGTNQYLTFNSQGQSASVVYSTTVGKYFIINTGALVS